MFDFDDEEIARQLTLVDFRLFSNIQPNEFLNQAWVKQRAPNIRAYIEHFNRTADVFAAAIVLQPTVAGRAYVMERVVRIASVRRRLPYVVFSLTVCHFAVVVCEIPSRILTGG